MLTSSVVVQGRRPLGALKRTKPPPAQADSDRDLDGQAVNIRRMPSPSSAGRRAPRRRRVIACGGAPLARKRATFLARCPSDLWRSWFDSTVVCLHQDRPMPAKSELRPRAQRRQKRKMELGGDLDLRRREHPKEIGRELAARLPELQTHDCPSSRVGVPETRGGLLR